MKCYNCEKPAMFIVGPEGQQFPLCLDCRLKYIQTIVIQNDQLERTMNYLTAQMESVAGTPGLLPRFPQREVKILQGGNVTLNNISVSNSAIGVLNTGNLEIVDSAISVLKSDPQTKDISDAIKKITNSIVGAQDLKPEKKNEAIEILSVVASEATAPRDKRKVAVVNRLLKHFPTLVQTSAAVIQIWQAVGPSIISYFK